MSNIISNKKAPFFNLFLIVILSVFSCKKAQDIIQPEKPTTLTTSNFAARESTLTHPGRTLSANCFQCHGTNGYAGELKIAGMGYSELLSNLNSFRTKNPKLDIMNFHSQSFTPAEIGLIADYFSKQ